MVLKNKTMWQKTKRHCSTYTPIALAGPLKWSVNMNLRGMWKSFSSNVSLLNVSDRLRCYWLISARTQDHRRRKDFKSGGAQWW